MPSTPSQIASTCARSARSAALNFSLLAEIGRRVQIAQQQVRIDRRQQFPRGWCRSRRRRRSSICVAFLPSFLATDLRPLTVSDSKPEHEETQQQREQQMSEATPRAGWQPSTYYPDPAIHTLDPRFEKYWWKLSAVERLDHRLRWAEGPVWFGDGRYLLVQRHSQRAHHQVGRGNRRGQHFPQAVELRQRQHPRPPGPAGHLRAWRPPRHPHRI